MAQAAALSRPSAFSAFHNRGFTLLWLGQLISTMGSALTSLAASILVFRLTHSALSVGLMLMATALPSLFVGLVAGVFVDRYDRRTIMIVSDLLRAGLVALIPFLISHNVAWLYIIILLESAVGQFFNPAQESILPEVASEEELASANSLMVISSFGSTAIGFAASGLIAAAYSIDLAFYIDALTFLFSVFCVLLVRIPTIKIEDHTSVKAVIQNLKSGLDFLFGTPILHSLFLSMVPVFIAFGLWNSLLLPFALRALKANEFQYGLQEGITSIGFVIGSLLMASLADRLREGQWLAIGFLFMGLIGVVYSVSGSIPLAIGLVAISGFLNAPTAIARRLVIQRNTPREVRGRVNSAFFVSRDVIFLVGMAAAGLADLVNVRVLMGASQAILILAGLGVLLMPGLAQPAEEWKKALRILRRAKENPIQAVFRPASLSDFDRLALRLPALSGLGINEKTNLASQAEIGALPAGTKILQQGEISDNAFFILEGRAVAGREENDSYRVLEILNPGDFFGEIAALTGVPRTADVVSEELTTLLKVPAHTIRQLMSYPAFNRLVLSKMTERMVRMNMIDMPRYAGLSQEALKELRTPD